MTKKRVAVVVPNLAQSGGVSTVGAFLYRTIEESGCYTAEFVSLATSAKDKASIRLRDPRSWVGGVRVEHDFWHGIPFQHVGAVGSELEFQRYRPRKVLTSLINEFDLVQIVAGAPAWALSCRHVRAPVLLQVASLIVVERRARLAAERGILGRWRRSVSHVAARLDMAALSHVDTVFVENQWMYECIRKRVGSENVVFAPPGVDTTFFRPNADLSRRDNFILSVGRFADPRKNIRMLFEAYHRLRCAMPSAPNLVLAGKSRPSPEDWMIAEALGLSRHIEILHEVSSEDLADLYQNAAIFVLASDEEGFGMVILEAMASGAPVISTRCGGPETLITDGENGFLTPVGDASALADRMRELLESTPRRREIGFAGRRKAEEQHSLAVAGNVFLERYDSVLRNRITIGDTK